MASFEEFVQVELPRLLGLAHALTGNNHDAWDLAQEALTRVGLHWSRIDTGGNPSAYARTTLVRLNVDRIRRLRREIFSDRVPDTGVEDRYAVAIAPWLLQAMNALTPSQRTAVVLRFTDDLDAAGIAREMGCSTGTARSHLSRGLQRLRDRANAVVTSDLEGR